MGRNVRCFRPSTHGHVITPTRMIGKHVTTRKFFWPHQLALDAERERVSDDSASLYSAIQSLTSLGCLSGPVLNDPIENPPGAGPGELFFRRQFFRSVDQVERTINHCRTIKGQHIGDSIGISDVEMRFADNDNFVYPTRYGWR